MRGALFSHGSVLTLHANSVKKGFLLRWRRSPVNHEQNEDLCALQRRGIRDVPRPIPTWKDVVLFVQVLRDRGETGQPPLSLRRYLERIGTPVCGMMLVVALAHDHLFPLSTRLGLGLGLADSSPFVFE